MPCRSPEVAPLSSCDLAWRSAQVRTPVIAFWASAVALATSSGEALVGRGKVIWVRLRRMSSGRVAANCRRSMTYRICQPAVLRMGSEYCLTGSFSTAASRVASSDPGSTQPSSPPAWAVAALGELLGDGGERRSALELLDDTVRAALGLVGEIGAVDRHENLGHPRLGLADIRPHPVQRVIDLGFRHVDLGPHFAADDLVPGDLRLDLLDRDLEGDADALQVLPELAVRHAGGALDVAEPLLHLAVGGLEPQSLGILDLQPLVDHLAQHLCGHPLAQFRTVLQTGRADGEQYALGQVEVGDGIVVHPRHNAQPLSRCEGRRKDDDDGDECAKERHGH